MKIIRTAKVCVLATSIILFLSNISKSPGFTGERMREGKREKAIKLWEQAVAAKGGRERLHAVRSLYMERKFRGLPDRIEDKLFVFPDKMWSFVMTPRKSSATFKNIATIDFGAGTCWSAHWNPEKGASEVSRCLVKRTGDYGKLEVLSRQWALLMETNWVRPTPLEARSGWVGLKRVDIVRAHVTLSAEGIPNHSGLLVDYYLDRKSHLPVKIRLKWDGEDEDGWDEDGTSYDDYVNINGIMLPQKLTPEAALFADPEHKEAQEYRYQINVDYNESIFSQPLDGSVGREAWRKVLAPGPGGI